MAMRSWRSKADAGLSADGLFLAANFRRRGEGRSVRRLFAERTSRGSVASTGHSKRRQAEREGLGDGLRVALHLHVFYPDQLPGIVERLNLNASAPDLFIQRCHVRRGGGGARGRILAIADELSICRSRQIWAATLARLLTQFGRALCAGYDIVGHLHTKKSPHVINRPFAEAWNTFLLENLLGGARGGAMLDAILSSMELDPTIGIVFPDDPHVISWTKNRKYAEDLAARMKWGDAAGGVQFSDRIDVLDAVRRY